MSFQSKSRKIAVIRNTFIYADFSYLTRAYYPPSCPLPPHWNLSSQHNPPRFPCLMCVCDSLRFTTVACTNMGYLLENGNL